MNHVKIIFEVFSQKSDLRMAEVRDVDSDSIIQSLILFCRVWRDFGGERKDVVMSSDKIFKVLIETWDE